MLSKVSSALDAISRTAISLWYSDRISLGGFQRPVRFTGFAAQFHEPAAARSSFRVPGVWLPHRGLPASIQCNKGASCSINPAKHGSFRQLDVLMGVRLIS